VSGPVVKPIGDRARFEKRRKKVRPPCPIQFSRNVTRL
jgi:hypothetical protein